MPLTQASLTLAWPRYIHQTKEIIFDTKKLNYRLYLDFYQFFHSFSSLFQNSIQDSTLHLIQKLFKNPFLYSCVPVLSFSITLSKPHLSTWPARSEDKYIISEQNESYQNKWYGEGAIKDSGIFNKKNEVSDIVIRQRRAYACTHTPFTERNVPSTTEDKRNLKDPFLLLQYCQQVINPLCSLFKHPKHPKKESNRKHQLILKTKCWQNHLGYGRGKKDESSSPS